LFQKRKPKKLPCPTADNSLPPQRIVIEAQSPSLELLEGQDQSCVS